MTDLQDLINDFARQYGLEPDVVRRFAAMIVDHSIARHFDRQHELWLRVAQGIEKLLPGD